MFMVLSSWQSHCESSPGSLKSTPPDDDDDDDVDDDDDTWARTSAPAG